MPLLLKLYASRDRIFFPILRSRDFYPVLVYSHHHHVLHSYTMPALTRLTWVSAQEWLGRFAKIFFIFTKMRRRYDSAGQSIILGACITAFWLIIEAKIYMGCTSCHNLIFARIFEHMEFMEYGEPIVKPDVTGQINQQK